MIITHHCLGALFCAFLLLGAGFLPAAETNPVAKVQIIQPRLGQILSGKVEVRLKMIPVEKARTPEQAYVGLGGPPWTKMHQDNSTGEFLVELDSCLVPNGPQTLTVLTDERRSRAALGVKVTNDLKCFWADLHSHTSHSDGATVPANAHDYARNVAKLDVFSLTDHLESTDENEWVDVREQAEKANQDGAFVVLPGLEWTRPWGHACIFDPQTRKWPTNIAAFFKAAADADVVLKINHPGNITNVFESLAYSEVGDKVVEMMEVRRPTEEKAFLLALKNGWHLAPEGSDDTHSADWGKVKSWTGIWAPGLSRRNIWAALKARHLFSSLDRNCQLQLEVNGSIMGDINTNLFQTVDVVVKVEDKDKNDLISKIELFEDGLVIQTDEPNSSKRTWKTSCTPPTGHHYYFAKVTQADTNMLWSAPVWVTVGTK